MLYVDTCVLLAVLMPEVHSCVAAAFLEEARAPLAIRSWSITELHSALGEGAIQGPEPGTGRDGAAGL